MDVRESSESPMDKGGSVNMVPVENKPMFSFCKNAGLDTVLNLPAIVGVKPRRLRKRRRTTSSEAETCDSSEAESSVDAMDIRDCSVFT